MKSSNIGGQAVLEGIMMKNGKDYAVAVRKPDKEIEVKKDEYRSFIKWEKLTKIPFIRGIFNFIDSMVLGELPWQFRLCWRWEYLWCCHILFPVCLTKLFPPDL